MRTHAPQGDAALGCVAKARKDFLDAGTSQGLLWLRSGAKPAYGRDFAKDVKRIPGMDPQKCVELSCPPRGCSWAQRFI